MQYLDAEHCIVARLGAVAVVRVDFGEPSRRPSRRWEFACNELN